jgi:hypothetical protein
VRTVHCFLLTVLLLLCARLGAQAGDEHAYIYDAQGYAVPCPDAYAVVRSLVLSASPAGSLDYPQDIALGAHGHLLISDQGNARVVEITATGDLVRELRNPLLGKPTGLFYDQRDGGVFVADAASNSILHFSAGGALLRVYPPPQSDVLPDNYLYSPTRILVDGRGWLAVIGTGSSGGIIQIDPEGVFRGFFGANPAPTSFLRKLSRLVASAEQKKAQLLQVLQPCTDFTREEDGFIATVTDTTSANQIRRLNPLGMSVYPAASFGEPLPSTDASGTMALDHAHLSCIAADAQGNIVVADRTSLKLFQYSAEGELLAVWGGRGTQKGSFQSITEIAVDRSDGTLYVLDGLAGTVQAFAPTAFARLVHEAAGLYADGRYEEAARAWAEVRARDANYPLANKGIGRILLRLGTGLSRPDYLNAAMERFEEAGDRSGYSEAFAAARRLWIQAAMPFLVIAAILLLALVVAFSRRRGSARGRRSSSPFRLWRVLRHPFDVMEEVKWACSGETVGAATLSLALAFGARVLRVSLMSFPFTSWDPQRVSIVSEAARLFLPFLTWVVANALVTAIFHGEGKVRQIYSASAFALVPLTTLTVLGTLLSHVFSLHEKSILDALEAIMIAWMLLLFLLGAATVHGFRMRKAIGTSLLSVAGVVILWGVVILVLGLVSTFSGFLIDVVKEATLRV